MWSCEHLRKCNFWRLSDMQQISQKLIFWRHVEEVRMEWQHGSFGLFKRFAGKIKSFYVGQC